MTDREKVIKALENCNAPEKCRDCPWEPCEEFDCKHSDYPDGLIGQAIALLKAQEPMVLTLWEAVGIIDRPVYLERNVLMPDKSVNRQESWALVCATDDEHMIRLATPYGEEKWHVGAYGIGWRCWTSRPTDEQRKKEPWNG